MLRTGGMEDLEDEGSLKDCYVASEPLTCDELENYCPDFTLHEGAYCVGTGGTDGLLRDYASDNDPAKCKTKC